MADRKIVDYRIVTSEELFNKYPGVIDYPINDYLKKEYIPYGSPFSQGGDILQAMVKYEDHENRKIVEYKFICGDPDKISSLVNEQIAKGYILFGSHSVCRGTIGQAMVKYEEKE